MIVPPEIRTSNSGRCARAAPAADATSSAAMSGRIMRLPRDGASGVQTRLQTSVQLLRDRAGLPSADLPAVDVHDRCYVSGRAGHEHLVHRQELLLGEGLLAHRHFLLVSDLEDQLAG